MVTKETKIINKKYPDFHSLYENERGTIYTMITESFSEVLKYKQKQKILTIKLYADDIEFDTDFLISRKNLPLLTDTILSYFEKMENYEMCNQIIKMLPK